MLKRGALIIYLLFSIASISRAHHIVGGEIFYDSLGNNKYKITIVVYRDCGSTVAFDSPLNYSVFSGNGSLFSQFPISISSVTPLVVIPEPCVTIPTDVCIESGIYIDTITLPFNTFGYTVSYQRCCFGEDLLNMTNPIENGITITTFIPGTNMVNIVNQAARFTNLPPLVICSNRTIQFDHSALDPDNDSLVYELVSPFSGGSSSNAVPDPETAPPYSDVNWVAGYTENQPFGPGSSISINTNTGQVTFLPNLLGEFVTGVAVKEFRNGTLINSSLRTFIFRVVHCDSIIPPFEFGVFNDNNNVAANNIIENCGSTFLTISRQDSTIETTIDIKITGTAINGVDYSLIPDSIVMPINTGSVAIPINSKLDGITEEDETIIFNIATPNPCNNSIDTTSFTMYINDYFNMEIKNIDTFIVCSDFEENVHLYANILNGVPNYTFDLQPGNFPNNDSIILQSSIFDPGINNYTLSITDYCGKSLAIPIVANNQCPLIIPNVITANDDGTNDLFIIKNLEDYETVELILVNRWGNLVYKNSNYENEWSGIDMNGNKLDVGTYFYTVKPDSEKYRYNGDDKTQFIARGFVQIIE